MKQARNQYQSEFVTDFFKDDENISRGYKSVGKSGFIRCVLLFGSAIIALTMVIVPILSEKANKETAQSLFMENVDTMSTGSIE